MAIAFQSGSDDGQFSVDSSTLSYTYDSQGSATDRCLIICVTYENNTSADVTAVTYNSVSMTHVASFTENAGGFDETTEVWELVAPATGSNTLAFTFSQTGRDFGWVASVFTGVDQTTPTGNTGNSGNYTTNTSCNVDLLVSADSMLVASCYQNRSNTGPWTARTSNTVPTNADIITASGNSGFIATLAFRGPESAGTFNVGADATTTSISGGALAVELLAATGGSAALTGTTVPTITETDVVSGGDTSIITLTGDTWVAAGATFNAQRQAIIDGFDAASSPTNGWNNEVRDNEVVTAVVRTSSTVVTVTWTAAASYNISSTETITCTVPNAALVTGTGDLTATPTFTVTAVVSGRIMSSLAGAGGLASLGGIAGKGGGLAG